MVQAPRPTTSRLDDKAIKDAGEGFIAAASTANDNQWDLHLVRAFNNYFKLVLNRARAPRHDASLLATKQDCKLLKKMSKSMNYPLAIRPQGMMLRAEIAYNALEFYDYVFHADKMVEIAIL